MKKITINIVLALLCLNFPAAQAQPTKTSGKLTVGDQFPVTAIKDIINTKTTAIDLNKQAKDLVILNFWTTWCSSCIKNFPKEEALQQQFKDRMQLYLVNGNDGDFKRGVQIVLDRYKENYGKRLNIPVVYPGDYITNLFRYTSYPHCVWLNKQGKIIGITDGEALTAANIEKALRGDPFNLPIKTD
ncbi:TlpA family protein disulfide reductase [Mucilaginibacter limnophilus]|uniref:TlpA family protein disulfide reductase n=1 Tax=Mucilaginibacter limnophilus TaxID=1932778 RepID=A0A437MLF0_9SPHI|nr:TlpA disulfide reductase family protein [Mucilaginibacter limnophilus]RVT98478.1 TlpA family protein disulfide reductase [Mucilaginibacter limnophilus]